MARHKPARARPRPAATGNYLQSIPPAEHLEPGRVEGPIADPIYPRDKLDGAILLTVGEVCNLAGADVPHNEIEAVVVLQAHAEANKKYYTP